MRRHITPKAIAGVLAAVIGSGTAGCDRAQQAAPPASDLQPSTPKHSPPVPKEVAPRFSLQLKGPVAFLALSRDARRLASATSTGKALEVWDLAAVKKKPILLATLQGGTGWLRTVAFSPDGKTVASRSSAHAVALWDARTGKETTTLEGHTRSVCFTAFGLDGERLAAVDSVGDIIIWDVRKRQPLATLHTDYRLGKVLPLLFSSDGRTLATTDDRCILLALWDVRARKETSIRPPRDDLRARASVAAPHLGSRTLAWGEGDGTIRLLDLTTGATKATLRGCTALTKHHGAVTALAFAPDGKILASGDKEGTVKFWDVDAGKGLKTMHGHRGAITALAFSQDGLVLASGGEDGRVQFADVPPPDASAK